MAVRKTKTKPEATVQLELTLSHYARLVTLLHYGREIVSRTQPPLLRQGKAPGIAEVSDDGRITTPPLVEQTLRGYRRDLRARPRPEGVSP
jgi:hypothetical protein